RGGAAGGESGGGAGAPRVGEGRGVVPKPAPGPAGRPVFPPGRRRGPPPPLPSGRVRTRAGPQAARRAIATGAHRSGRMGSPSPGGGEAFHAAQGKRRDVRRELARQTPRGGRREEGGGDGG